MMIKSLFLRLLPLCLLLGGCFFEDTPNKQPVLTPELEAARNKAMVLCSGCHGPEGIGTADFNPNLACQKKVYMVKQLKDYREGRRSNHIPMVNIARMLSEEEVELISEWYSLVGCP